MLMFFNINCRVNHKSRDARIWRWICGKRWPSFAGLQRFSYISFPFSQLPCRRDVTPISFNELLHPLIDTCLRSDECWLYWMFLALFLLRKWTGRWRNKHKTHINEIRRRSRLILTNFPSNWGRVNLWFTRKRRGALRTVPPKKRVREKLFFSTLQPCQEVCVCVNLCMFLTESKSRLDYFLERGLLNH